MVRIQLGDPISHPCNRSRRVVTLGARVQQLAASLSITASLVSSNQEETDRLHAFRVLMHAEIQAYVESIATNVLDVTERLARTSRLTHAGHHLLVYHALHPLNAARSSGNAKYPDFSVTALRSNWHGTHATLEMAIDAHRRRIKGNNGIKPSNLNMLLIPIGFRDSFFAERFRDKMKELGEKRGQVAHGAGALIPTIPTGAGELNLYRDVEAGLRDMDRYAPRVLIPAW
ncbi:HEPN domain-containing protein [Streptomyces termitum]|uniref:HEPN domain-containing protein n=1 Tax=Streptomyces termitum TaxID=67368 RepID=UPI0033B0B0A4